MKMISGLTLMLSYVHFTIATTTVQTLTSSIPMPQITQNYEDKVIRKAKTERVVEFSYPLIHNEISGELYVQYSNTIFSQSQAYNKSLYKPASESDCQYYRSQLSIYRVGNLTFNERDEQMIKYYTEHSRLNSNLYVLMNNGKIYHYGIGKADFSQQFVYELPNQIKKYISKFSDQAEDEQIPDSQDNDGNETADKNAEQPAQAQSPLTSNIELFMIHDRLLLFLESGQAYIFNEHYPNELFQKAKGYKFKGVLEVGAYEENSVWVHCQKQVAVYKLVIAGVNANLQEQFKLTIDEIQHEEGDQAPVIQQVTVHRGRMFILTVDYLYLLALSDIQYVESGEDEQNRTIRDFTVVYGFGGQYECLEMKIIDAHLLYLTCRYQRNYFLIEICFKDKDGKFEMNINRFYDDSTVQGIRKVESIGKDNIAFIGDDFTYIQGKGYNRNILLQMLQKKKRQFSQSQYSFGLIDIINLQTYSNQRTETDLMIQVTQNEFNIMKISHQPAEIWCYFDHYPEKPIINLLIVFNASHCPTQHPSDLVANSMQEICQSYYPSSIDYQTDQIEKSKAFHIFVFILTLISITAIICMYCGTMLRRKADQTIEKIQQKIQKMKQQRQMSELKKL